jgi:hypothetical protein
MHLTLHLCTYVQAVPSPDTSWDKPVWQSRLGKAEPISTSPMKRHQIGLRQRERIRRPSSCVFLKASWRERKLIINYWWHLSSWWHSLGCANVSCTFSSSFPPEHQWDLVFLLERVFKILSDKENWRDRSQDDLLICGKLTIDLTKVLLNCWKGTSFATVFKQILGWSKI